MLTEVSSRKRASLHLVAGAAGLAAHDPGGLEVLDAGLEEFRAALTRENHTLKRALTDPRTFSGIGNAYSDEILHAARLSPVTWTSRLDEEEVARLFAATRAVLTQWRDRLCEESRRAFPEKVTAFRKEMAVHGKFGHPCPVCATAVQRIVYASNETNYCPRCQTEGKLLADRALSQLLRGDWPKTIEELEERLSNR
jgi:formamidopyrimidine-DNA glycosylase